MASIEKRGDVWRVRIIRKGHPTVSKTFPTRRDCEKFAAITEGDMARGIFKQQSSAERVTFRELLQRYMVEVSPTKRGRIEEVERIASLLKPESAARPLLDKIASSLTGADVAKWRDARGKEVAPATVVREWGILSHALEIARVEWSYSDLANPFKSARKPVIQNARHKRISPEELDALCAATGSAELALLVRLAVETGARRGELLALQWRDIDLKARTARLLDGATKNGHGRTLPLSGAALTLLGGMARRLDGGTVFSLQPDSVSQAFRRAAARARKAYEESCAALGRQPEAGFLVGLKFHDSRHEACSRLAEKGFSTLEIASVSGHRTLQLLGRYVHLKPEDLAARLA